MCERSRVAATGGGVDASDQALVNRAVDAHSASRKLGGYEEASGLAQESAGQDRVEVARLRDSLVETLRPGTLHVLHTIRSASCTASGARSITRR